MAYGAYRSAGLPWLDQVPQHWELRRAKTLLRERSEKGFPDEPLLAATQTKGVVRKENYESRTVLAMNDLDLLKLVRVGDFVISLRSFQGGIEYARDQGIISPAYTVLYPADAGTHAYLAWLFKSKPFVESLSLFVTGIRQGQNIDYERLARSRLPLPPSRDREAIVRFLDHADRRIRRAIRAKQQLIALLNEQKHTVIHRAVTRGLDPDVRLKPSGMDWLGDVPEHWEVVPLKRRVGFQEGPGIMATDFRDKGVPLLRISCLTGAEATLEGCNFLDPREVARRWNHFAVRPGDYLISASGSLGSVSRATEVVAGAIPYTGILRLWARDEHALEMDYLRHFLSSELIAAQIRFMKAGVGIEHFGPTHLKRMTIVLPSLREQRELARVLMTGTEALERAVATAVAAIDALREFRTRLIADVVTGKLDVREAAARLPDEVDEPEPLDAMDIDAEPELEDQEPVEA